MGLMKSAAVILVLLVVHGFADLAPDEQIQKVIRKSDARRVLNELMKRHTAHVLKNQADLKEDNEKAGIDFDLIARALKQLQKTPLIIKNKEEDQHEPEGGERLIQETLKGNVDPDSKMVNLLESMFVDEGSKHNQHPEGIDKVASKKGKVFGDTHDGHRLTQQQTEELNQNGDRKRNFLERAHLWTDYIIPYTIDSSLSNDQKSVDVINKAIKQFSDYTCLKWVPKGSTEAAKASYSTYIEFFSQSGCWSYVGRVFPDKQQISLQNPGCISVSTAVHEMAHAIGQKHEQSRNDRDNYVTVLWSNIRGGEDNHNMAKSKTLDNNPYDYESVLQYSLTMALHEKVQFYHSLGFNQDEILQYLSELNNVVISKRTLKRVLSSAHLYRRKHYSDLLEVALFLEGKLETADKLHGYKLMHLQCIQSGYTVTQETVRLLLQIIDPQGVQLRRRGRLRRRIYSNPGPDFMWHIDSYDKLKPYGICINGCIDGFSRHIIWLEAYSTNSDPAVIASYFMSAVESRKGCPKRIRADMGTENGHVENMHKFLRYEDVDEFAQRCFLYGSSNHNQRIEAWWSYLRSHHAQFWISFFHEMKEEDQFCGNFLDKNLAQFCFMQLIQDELQEVVHLWNTHRMRQSPHQISPSGRPLTMYRLPHLYNAEHHLCQVSLEKIRVCKEECSFKGPCPCDRDIFELCCLLMAEDNLQPPVNSDTAKRLYNALRNNILQSL